MTEPNDAMRSSWNSRAQANAFHYIETGVRVEEPSAFFALGEALAKRIIDPVLPDKAQRGLAIDIGCGLGRFSRALSSRFQTVVGLDVSDEMVRRGAALHEAYPQILLQATDGRTYPVETATADFAFSYVVFQHMPSLDVIQQNIDEIGRVLKPGATALIHVKHRYKNAAHALIQHLPEGLMNTIKQGLMVDPLKLSPSYRGVGPLPRAALEAMFSRAGLSIRTLRADDTHTPAHEYVFVHATRQ